VQDIQSLEKYCSDNTTSMSVDAHCHPPSFTCR
jgi:hypothetical protein